MGFFRRGTNSLLTFILLLSLLGVALGAGLRLTIGNPSTVKTELKDSGVYQSFAGILIEQAKDSSMGSRNDADFNNPLVKQAADQALSAEFLEKQGNSLIDSNYDWLTGKTEKPEFRLDLSPARQQFATNTGAAVAKRLSLLPTCTNDQLAQLQDSGRDTDFYNLNCVPFTTDPDEAGEEVTKNLVTDSSFLNNAVLTADDFNPSDESESQQEKPYYEKLGSAPDVYEALLWSPFIAAALAFLSGLAVLFLSQTRKKGVRRIAIQLLIAGVLIIVSKLVIDFVFRAVSKNVSSPSENAALVESFLKLLEGLLGTLTTYNMIFGGIFIVLAIIMLIAAKRRKGNKQQDKDHLLAPKDEAFVPPTQNGIEANLSIPEDDEPAAETKPADTTPTSSAPAFRTTPTAPPIASSPKKKRPPRLIQ